MDQPLSLPLPSKLLLLVEGSQKLEAAASRKGTAGRGGGQWGELAAAAGQAMVALRADYGGGGLEVEV